MKYLLTFNIKYIFVFTVLAFALLFTVLASSTTGQDDTTTGVRGSFHPYDDYLDPFSLDEDIFDDQYFQTIGADYIPPDVQEDIKGGKGSTKLGCSLRALHKCKGIEELVNAIYKSLFVFGGVLGVFMIMFRGIAITIATAQGAVVKRDDAITDFENVVIGLGLLALSYIILNIINPDILIF